MSDSQATLRPVRVNAFSELVAECLDALKRLTTKCKLILMRIPGNMGIVGNEIAD
jgi:hypothetical protein